MSADNYSFPGWIVRGHCHVLGDDIGVDGDLIAHEFAVRREMDPEVLRQHLLLALDPLFPQKIKPSDLIVAGKRFAQGNPHIQGLLALRGAGVGVLSESMPYSSVRNGVNAGLRFMPHCPQITQLVQDGDELVVDFETGHFQNITRNVAAQFKPLDPYLRGIVEGGGWKHAFRQRLMHPSAPTN
jgi:3-isopropylmalate/(R)-2-methylmalate dehydratase small subunit